VSSSAAVEQRSRRDERDSLLSLAEIGKLDRFAFFTAPCKLVEIFHIPPLLKNHPQIAGDFAFDNTLTRSRTN
jgi:hypothetical protein